MEEINKRYFYIGNDLDNSFEFKISKIHNDDIIIVTGSGKNTNVFKIKKEHFENEKQLGKIKELNLKK